MLLQYWTGNLDAGTILLGEMESSKIKLAYCSFISGSRNLRCIGLAVRLYDTPSTCPLQMNILRQLTFRNWGSWYSLNNTHQSKTHIETSRTHENNCILANIHEGNSVVCLKITFIMWFSVSSSKPGVFNSSSEPGVFNSSSGDTTRIPHATVECYGWCYLPYRGQLIYRNERTVLELMFFFTPCFNVI